MARKQSVLESSTISKADQDGQKVVNGFRMLEDLGTGSFAKVKLCERVNSGERFAMKIFRKGILRKQRDFLKDPSTGGMRVRTSLDKVYNEIAIMRRIEHENCIRLVAVFDEAEATGKLYAVIEYAARGCTMDWDADLCTYRAHQSCQSRQSRQSPTPTGLIQEGVARGYVCDALRGLECLHALRVAHRDIKPQNLLVDARGRVKIGDFGVALEMGPDCVVVGTEGSYCFFSPEMCRTPYSGHDGRHADIWAVGVTLWAFLHGFVPFLQNDVVALLDSIAAARFALPAETPASESCQAFMHRLLTPDPKARPLAKELLADAWCLGGVADGQTEGE